MKGLVKYLVQTVSGLAGFYHEEKKNSSGTKFSIILIITLTAPIMMCGHFLSWLFVIEKVFIV